MTEPVKNPNTRLDEPIVGPWDGVDHDAYHADRLCENQSGLKTLLDNPSRYRGEKDGTIPSKPPSRSRRVGTLTHQLVLLPNDPPFSRPETCELDGAPLNLRLKAHREWFATLSAGKLLADPEELAEARAMAAALHADPEFKQILGMASATERAIRWQEQMGDQLVWGKALEDLVVYRHDGDRDLIVDLKSSRDVSPRRWAMDAENYGYHVQNAWYTGGHLAAYGRDARFVFVCVESSPPHTVAKYELSEGWVEAGRDFIRNALAELVDRRKRNDWLPDYARGVITLPRPRWAGKDQTYSSIEGESNGHD